MRAICLAFGLVFAVAAAALAALGAFPPAAIVAVWAIIFLGGVAIERWRYQRLGNAPPGPDWQLTGERFIDPETGRLVTVHVRPATGERRYVAG